MLKPIIIILLCIAFAYGCNREMAVPEPPPVQAVKDTIIQNEPVYAGDSVTITWSVPVDTNFVQFIIYRTYEGGYPVYIGTRDATATKKFTDTTFSYARVTEYQITGVLKKYQPDLASNIRKLVLDSIAIELQMPVANTDSVLLNWSIKKPKNLEKVTVLYKNTGYNIWYPRGEFNGMLPFSYKDTLHPYGEKISYKIAATFKSGYSIESNEVTAEIPLPELKLEIVKASSVAVELRWKLLRPAGILGYWILRDPGNGFFSTVNLSQIHESIPYYTDERVPHASSVTYKVVATLPGGKNNPAEGITSNLQTYNRSGIYNLATRAFDMQLYAPLNTLYCFEKNGRVLAYDLTRRALSTETNLNTEINFSTMGQYNGQHELYIASRSGILYIYDAVTLKLKDQISTGATLLSAACSKNLLFVSTDDATAPLKLFDRSAKALKATAGTSTSSRLKPVPGGDREFVEVAPKAPLSVTYYHFSAAGELLERRGNTSFIAPFNYLLFEIMPGRKIVTANDGTLYSLYGDPLGTFAPRTPSDYLSYAFNSAQNELFTGTNYRQIEVRNLDNYAFKKRLFPNVLPLYLFHNGQHLISIGDVYGYDIPVYNSIEFWDP